MWVALLLLIYVALLALFVSKRALSTIVLCNLVPTNPIRPLEWFSFSPRVLHLIIPSAVEIQADLYLPADASFTKVYLVIHGATAVGKDDGRIKNLGRTFARAGIAVCIPTFPDLTMEHVSPRSTREIIDAFQWLKRTYPQAEIGMFGFSIATGPMFIAAADPAIRDDVRRVVSFGGYERLKEVLRYLLTDPTADQSAREALSNQLLKFFPHQPAVRSFLQNRNPRTFDAVFDALPTDAQQFIRGLDPKRRLPKITARKIVLAHNNPDTTVPFSQSLALRRHFGSRTSFYELASFEHVDIRLPQLSFSILRKFFLPEFFKLNSMLVDALYM